MNDYSQKTASQLDQIIAAANNGAAAMITTFDTDLRQAVDQDCDEDAIIIMERIKRLCDEIIAERTPPACED